MKSPLEMARDDERAREWVSRELQEALPALGALRRLAQDLGVLLKAGNLGGLGPGERTQNITLRLPTRVLDIVRRLANQPLFVGEYEGDINLFVADAVAKWAYAVITYLADRGQLSQYDDDLLHYLADVRRRTRDRRQALAERHAEDFRRFLDDQWRRIGQALARGDSALAASLLRGVFDELTSESIPAGDFRRRLGRLVASHEGLQQAVARLKAADAWTPELGRWWQAVEDTLAD